VTADKCICGGEVEFIAEFLNTPGYLRSETGKAHVKRLSCGLNMTVSSNNIGRGESLGDLYYIVGRRWNKVMQDAKDKYKKN